MKTPLLVTLATAVGLPFAFAQEERRPENPPRPPDPPHQPGPRPAGPGEHRHDGVHPPVGSADRRPDGDRGPGQPPNDLRRTNPDGGHHEHQRPEGDRREGKRFELQLEDGQNRERPRLNIYTKPPRPQKPTPYLGVVTAAVSPALGAQLGLPEGFGLVVEDVIPDSPAASAGVQRFDVIKQLNDQQLVDPNQLAALVRSRGKDAEVTLTVLRKGEEQKLNVRIAERMLPERRAVSDDVVLGLRTLRDRAEGGARGLHDSMGKMKNEYAEKMKEFNQRMEKLKHEHAGRMEEFRKQMHEYGKRMGEFQERTEKWRQNPNAAPQPQLPEPPKAPEPPTLPQVPEPPSPPSADLAPEPAKLLREVRPGGASGVRVEKDGNVTVWNTANARAVIKDEEGEVELRNEDGKRTVTARGPDGTVTFTGPIDSEERRAALPEAVRRKLDRMDTQVRGQKGGAPAGHPDHGHDAGASATTAGQPPVPAQREIQ